MDNNRIKEIIKEKFWKQNLNSDITFSTQWILFYDFPRFSASNHKAIYNLYSDSYIQWLISIKIN